MIQFDQVVGSGSANGKNDEKGADEVVHGSVSNGSGSVTPALRQA